MTVADTIWLLYDLRQQADCALEAASSRSLFRTKRRWRRSSKEIVGANAQINPTEDKIRMFLLPLDGIV